MRRGDVAMAEKIEKILGIDLGTSNTSAAFMAGNKIVSIEFKEGSTTLYGLHICPSYVSYDPTGNVVLEHGGPAKSRLPTIPKRTISNMKRLIGKSYEEGLEQKEKLNLSYDIAKREDGTVDIITGTKVKSVEEVTADFLKRIKKEAETFINEPIRKAVITVPAYFNANQIEATKKAGKLAGFEEPDILFEPIASARTYSDMLKGQSFPARGYLMIIDLGAGTLDIVVIQNQYIDIDIVELEPKPYREEIDPETFRTKAIQGNYNLGGVDMDAKIVDYVLGYIKNKYNVDLQADSRIMPLILEKAEEAKIQLSTEENTIIFITYGRATYQVPLTRDKLEELVQPLIDECREPIRNALKEAGINKEDIDDVIIVGGPANMPIFQRIVEEEVGHSLRRISFKKEIQEKLTKREIKETDIQNIVEAKDWDTMGCVAKGAAIRIKPEETTNYSHGLVISTIELLDAVTDERISSLIDLIKHQPGIELILERCYNLKK